MNFGRIGFLTSAEGHQLEEALRRVFAGEYRMVELCTLAASLAEGPQVAVNDVVVTSAEPGRMVELGWEVGGEELGSQPCDGLICCTPSGSTAYNLSQRRARHDVGARGDGDHIRGAALPARPPARRAARARPQRDRTAPLPST